MLKPPELPDDFGTAQVIGQSARAAGAPRSKGGGRGDMFQARINSRSGGGAAGARTRTQQQQPGVEVTVRQDVRLPGPPNKTLQVPTCTTTLRTQRFPRREPWQAGRGADQRGGPLQQASLRPHGMCDEELRARGGQDSTEVWKCPTTAEGESGCMCSKITMCGPRTNVRMYRR